MALGRPSAILPYISARRIPRAWHSGFISACEAGACGLGIHDFSCSLNKLADHPPKAGDDEVGQRPFSILYCLCQNFFTTNSERADLSSEEIPD